MIVSTDNSGIDLSATAIGDSMRLRMLNEQFRAEGFLRIDRLAGSFELDEIDGIYASVVHERYGRGVERFVSRPRGGFDPSVVTIVAPEANVPALMETTLVRRARALLMAMFDVGTEAELVTDCRLFFKPPGSEETPWHQDAANRPRPHNGGSVWIALDDATDESGAMAYLPGSHTGALLPHSFDADHFHTDPPDARDVVVAPVLRGGATVHHCLTLHSASSNRSERPRRALVVVAQLRRLSNGGPNHQIDGANG